MDIWIAALLAFLAGFVVAKLLSVKKQRELHQEVSETEEHWEGLYDQLRQILLPQTKVFAELLRSMAVGSADDNEAIVVSEISRPEMGGAIEYRAWARTPAGEIVGGEDLRYDDILNSSTFNSPDEALVALFVQHRETMMTKANRPYAFTLTKEPHKFGEPVAV